ncbi:SDR family NAD(P)-dependent oxidoreductase [Microbacterium lushaniae]|uniref:SDR family NAD(P)-dependent oxidoreductase n=1 Tax=Microbacterium lushaniae TaxID=2614639 RepID=A0A5J6L7U3_9MICO|nr:SDR family NAD(P)-dependent oxidoreductase [Microbacterium lushaniae]QEW04528.1 SDR family NAD(P)-dependent oxidoreductase [Microbacterium lushaniae]
MQDFAGRVAVITGGASGVGFGQAQVFGDLGCRVTIVDMREEALQAAAETLRARGIDVHPLQLDVRDRVAWERAADDIEARWGAAPSLLFNTAGVNGFGPLEEASYADFDWIMGVNFGGVVNGIVTLLPRMLAGGTDGHIVSVASMGGFQGSPSAAIYAASKAAVINLMESYALTLPAQGIGVSVLCPASVRSDIAHTLDRRPAELASGSSFITDERFIELQRRLYAGGMDPVELAEHVREAIVADRFWVLPFTETRDGLRAHFDSILAAYDDCVTDPDAAAERARTFDEYRAQSARLRDS